MPLFQTTCVSLMFAVFRNDMLETHVGLHFKMPRRSPRLQSPYFLQQTSLSAGAPLAKSTVKVKEEDVKFKVKFSPGPLLKPIINEVPDINLRIQEPYFHQDCELLARDLLGKILVRRTESGTLVWGRIVETEAYLGGPDKASHTYNFRKTERNMAAFMKPGTLYVFSIYGMHYCINISSFGDGAVVLIRAAEPLGGIEYMKQQRGTLSKKTGVLRELETHQLCSGPSRLCIAFGIGKMLDKVHLSETESFWLQHGTSEPDEKVIVTSRVGLGSTAGDWKDTPLRFYLHGSPSVSVRNRRTENVPVKVEARTLRTIKKFSLNEIK